MPVATVEQDAKRMLQSAGHRVDEIFRIESPGDSGSGCIEILFLADAKPKVAYVGKDPKDLRRTRVLEVVEGW